MKHMAMSLHKLKNREGSGFYLGTNPRRNGYPLARDAVQSYKQLPLNIYQIQPKYRHEKTSS